MPKRPEDEIQKKLVELEISIKDEELKKQVPAAKAGEASAQLTVPGETLVASMKDSPGAEMGLDITTLGGWACIIFGLVMFFNHIQIRGGAAFPNPFFGQTQGGMIGFLFIPLMVGLAMLFYNYKSRAGQLVTVGSLAAIVLLVLSQLNPFFPPLTVLQFVIMLLPISIGGMLLMKAHFKRLALHNKSHQSK